MRKELEDAFTREAIRISMQIIEANNLYRHRSISFDTLQSFYAARNELHDIYVRGDEKVFSNYLIKLRLSS